MDEEVIYADLNVCRDFAHKSSPKPSLPQGVHQGPCGHKSGLKLGCIVTALLALTVTGLSVSVILLKRTIPTGISNAYDQENKNETTEISLRCTEPWTPFQGKCLFFSISSNSWNKSQDECCTKGSSLLLIQNKEEVRHILNQTSHIENKYWIGLKFISQGWEWINGSSLNDNILQIEGYPTENSCVSIAKTKLVSENCQAKSKWICQKKPNIYQK